MKKVEKHISQIKIGDTVLHGGKLLTVGRRDIKSGYGKDTSLFGDTYLLGRKPVIKVLYPKRYKGEQVGWH